jgi:hypothetical protein
MSYSQISKTVKKSPSRTGTRKTKTTPSPSTSSGPSGGWEGIEVPTGVKRDRMVHIDAALQHVRRLDRGDMTLPSAKSP